MKPDKLKKGRHSWPSVVPCGKWVKWFSKRKNRAATRDTLHHEKYDAIPSNKPVKTEDIWGWD
jgi:hypothetical protein